MGDVIFNQRYELREILESIPGIKILTVGNHDRRTGTNNWFLRMGFNYVCKSHEFKGILFSHKPIDIKDYPGVKWNVHGHLHSNTHDMAQYPFYDPAVHIKVSVEETNYMPVPLDKLVAL